MALTIDKIKNINIPINVSRKPDNYPPSTRGISLYNDSVNLYDAISLFMASAPPATFNIGEGLLGNGSALSPLSWAGVNHTAALSGNGSVGSPLDVADKGVTLSKLAQSGATLNQIIKWDGTNWVPSNETGGATSFVPLSRELTINGVTYDLSQNRSWTIGSTAYPSAGIPVSTGSAWGTSIVNNSTNWNTAFSWGNHALAGYLTSAAIGVTVQPYNANTVIDGSYVHTDNNYTTAEKSKLAGIQAGAEVNVNADWNAVSGDAQILNKPSIPLVDSVPTSGSTNAVSSGSVFTALSFKADLVGGKVPAIQLPSYVDDVLEGYYNGTSFFIDSTFSIIMTPETGKIYINLLNNTSYRYTGSVYVQISNTVSSLNDLTDVTIGTLNNGQILQYNGTTSQWENVSVTIGSGDMQKSVYDIDNDGVVDYAETIAVDVRNNSSSDTLYRGTIVYLSGSTGTHPNAVKAQANSEATSSGTFGVVINDISPNSSGVVAAMGTLHNLDTRTGANGNPNPFTSDTLLDGDVLWLDPNTAGYVTKTKPSAPNHAVFIGVVARTHPTSGRIVYKIQNGYEVEELHNVKITSPLVNNQVLRYNDSNSLWENKTLNFQVPLTLNTTPSSGASTLAGDGTLTIPNYTLSGLGGVPTTRTLTINGTSYDLSADRSWTVSTASALDDLTDVVVSSPTSGQVLSYNGTNWVNTTGGGGGGTPAGNTGEIQFNNAGAFAADSDLIWNGTDLILGDATGSGATLNVFKLATGSPIQTRIALFNGYRAPNQGEATIEVGQNHPDGNTTRGLTVIGGSNIFGNTGGFIETKNPITRAISFNSLGAVKVCGSQIGTLDYTGLSVGASTNIGSNVPTTEGVVFRTISATMTSTGGNANNFNQSSFGQITVNKQVLPTTYTDASNVYIAGPPIQGTATLTNRFSLFVASGNSYFAENIGVGLKIASARLHVRGSDDLSTSSALLVQNNATTPANLLDIRNNGNTNLGTGFNWDNVNGRLGIGINAPTTQLEIKGNSDASFKMSGGTAGRFFSIKYFNAPAACEFEADNIFRVKIGSNYPLYIAGSGIVLINGVSPNASAQFQIDSTTRGFLPPRMSTTNKIGITSPAQGLVVYDTTMQALSAYNGSNWATVGGGEQVINITGSTQTINFNEGNIADVTLSSSTTLTLTGGTFGTFVIKLTQDATGGRTVTWPATVKWSNGTPPSLTTTGGKTDIVSLIFDGTNYYGTYALNF